MNITKTVTENENVTKTKTPPEPKNERLVPLEIQRGGEKIAHGITRKFPVKNIPTIWINLVNDNYQTPQLIPKALRGETSLLNR